MKGKVIGFIELEGSPLDMAMYTSFLLDAMKQIAQEEQRNIAKKDVDAVERLLNMSLEQLIQKEKEEDDKDD